MHEEQWMARDGPSGAAPEGARESPLHISGGMVAGLVLHPEAVHQEGGEGIVRVGPEEQVRVSVEQNHGDHGQVENGMM